MYAVVTHLTKIGNNSRQKNCLPYTKKLAVKELMKDKMMEAAYSRD